MANEPSMDQAFLQKLREVVEDNLENEDFGVRELAREAGLSRSQMHRKLKKLTGQSGSRFIREIRLQHAMELLQKNAATASEIAYRVGFSSPTYFSTCFHDYYGFPPGEAADKSSKEIEKARKNNDISSTKALVRRPKQLSYLALAFVVVLLLIASYFYLYQEQKPGPASQNSIAVLPLDNLTGETDQTFFVQGLHDALIGELGKLSNLRVISRTSTLPFKSPESSLQEIATQLEVNNIVEGSVYSVGDSIRIQLQLIGIQPEEHHRWAQSYNGTISNVLNILNDVSREIANEIQLTITPEEQNRLNKSVTINRETYRAYLKGMFYLNKTNLSDVEKGLRILHEAVEKNPTDPMAYAGLAQGYINLGHGPTPSQDAFQKARAAAKTAIKLDSTNAEAYSALGSYKLYYERDWRGAEKAFKSANKLNPNLPWNHYHYAWLLYLAGRENEAISEHKLAHELDPLNPYINGWLAWLYAHYKQYELAKQEAESTFTLDKGHPLGHLALALSYIQRKQFKKAIPELKKAAAVSAVRRGALGHGLALAGQKGEARNLLDELKNEELTSFKALQIASIYAGLGNNDEAFKWLSYKPPHGVAPWVHRMIRFDSLRSDPRYQQLLARFKLKELDEVASATAFH